MEERICMVISRRYKHKIHSVRIFDAELSPHSEMLSYNLNNQLWKKVFEKYDYTRSIAVS